MEVADSPPSKAAGSDWRPWFGIVLLAWASLMTFPTCLHAEDANDRWYVKNDSETVVIFVHGIFSDSKACWTSNQGTYWPDIVKRDARLGNPSIYLGGYDTSFSSGLFGVYDAADELLKYLTTPDADLSPAPIEKKNLLFIAHSTGGLVVRQMLVKHADLFHNKTVGLLLMASPSRGSAWANRLKWLSEYYSNRMATDLQRDNSYVNALDRDFADLVSKKEQIPKLAGMDIFESRFIIATPWYKLFTSNEEFVVSAEDSASYFGAYKIIPNSDHFSIVKPSDARDPVETYLVNFYLQDFVPLSGRSVSAVQGWGAEPSATGRKLFHAQIDDFAGEPANFNAIWAQGITYRINSVISAALRDAPMDFQFEGTDIVKAVDPANFELLSTVGRELNGVAVAATLIQEGDAGKYLTESTFRSMYNPPDGVMSFPAISEEVPAGPKFGPITLQQALSNTWGYYVVLSLAARCLSENTHLQCDRNKLVVMLSETLKGLGPNNDALSGEFSRLIALARATRP
jgi:pimeloyl-ACP methyl ester carboxylesterase